MNTKKIAIIDPVGKKAGMDYYDLSLLKSIHKNSFWVYCLSNFTHKDIKCKLYFNSKPQSNSFYKVFNLISGLLYSSFFLFYNNVKYVIIHSFGNTTTDLLTLLSVLVFTKKRVLILHDLESFGEDTNMYILRFYLKYLVSTIVVHNNYSKEEFEKMYGKILSHKVKVIRHGNYNDYVRIFDQSEIKRKLSIDKFDNIFLFFGQIKEDKDLLTLLKAFKKVEKSLLIIAGREWKTSYKKYKEYIDINNLNHSVLQEIRYINDYEKDLYFSVADCIIIPYKKIYQSGVLIMALSYKKPVIVSDLKPNLELINSENGLAFKAEDSDDLFEKMNFFISNKAHLTQKFAINNEKLLNSELDWGNIGLEYIKLLTKN